MLVIIFRIFTIIFYFFFVLVAFFLMTKDKYRKHKVLKMHFFIQIIENQEQCEWV